MPDTERNNDILGSFDFSLEPEVSLSSFRQLLAGLTI